MSLEEYSAYQALSREVLDYMDYVDREDGPGAIRYMNAFEVAVYDDLVEQYNRFDEVASMSLSELQSYVRAFRAAWQRWTEVKAGYGFDDEDDPGYESAY